jgi:glycosyltransferase involved in cell wall biosynthesis
MKKCLLFVIRDFKQGGVPRCLQSLLQHLDKDQYDVKVYCMHHDGPYKGNMPNCEVLPEDKVIRSLLTYRSQASISGKLLKVVRTIGRKIFRWDLLDWRFKKVAKTIKCDIAIAYAEGFPARFVSNVKSQKKLVWIHNDYRFDSSPATDTPFEIFDTIVCCSNSSKSSFVELYPQFTAKSITIHNFTNESYILSKSREDVIDARFDKFTVISVGRIDYPKHFDKIPTIASRLKKSIDFNWYIVGDGPDEVKSELINEIRKYSVEDCVHLLGMKENPYKYLAKANVFAMTSRFECYPTVVNEALVLGVPVVSNDIPVAYEMISSGNGLITDYEHFADAIIEASKLKPHFVSENEEILKKLDELFA